MARNGAIPASICRCAGPVGDAQSKTGRVLQQQKGVSVDLKIWKQAKSPARKSSRTRSSDSKFEA
ncbi:hypothetical protein F441_18144 [Phytophthora nicotianae CJ01A1]|uniref:Uncharacterized protein n=3 Tax=Phytophthora nicotianae TaxID=4792 RepID=W2YGN5_PHYNI|nr:hypothetical protein F444_18296 [Phytophthora nicotianae P1976]ETP05211.1 hypothetical protein F441_18144 [Phytophthora nicotianae CJ01A1]ETP33344.1 hypothetical protein F442_18114 [Phytophthora nicotianae P10297]